MLINSRKTEINYEPRGFPQATHTLTPGQKLVLTVLAVLLVCGLILWPRRELLLLNLLVSVLYFASTLYRLLLIDLSLRHSREISISAAELDAVPDSAWPHYLVLVPLYREAAVLPHLVRSLAKLDYPADRLEIRLLIEADDNDTMATAKALPLPAQFRIFPIPDTQPRTKPKACNVGMEDSNAQFAVIYDAEDRPEPDQLKKAVLAFRRLPPEIACVQAKLNFYNPRQNFLTRCFTAEYATWFDLCLPGLDCLGAPIPLGGTSNHFPLKILRELGGWDEYNVTEDCDLGLRLFRRGLRTRILDSTTWEQACPDLKFWIRQRSRWVKGYVQTYLVHMRSPLRLLREIGPVNWLHFQLLIGGSPLCQLINPLYWLMAVLWFFLQPAGLDVYFPGPVFAMAAVCLFAGNFIFAYTSSVACVRRGFGSLAIYGMAMPFYWILMSFAAWKGVLQLFNRPHFWEKTRHFESNEDTAFIPAVPPTTGRKNPAAVTGTGTAGAQPRNQAVLNGNDTSATPGFNGRIFCLVLLLTLLRLCLPFSAAGAQATAHEYIVQALLHQLNWGRQALFASFEYPPLASITLFVTEVIARPFSFSALHLLTAFCQALTFCYVLRTPQTGKRKLLTAGLVLLLFSMPGVRNLVLSPDPGWVLPPLFICAFYHLLQWQRQPALRDEIITGICCGFGVFAGPAGIIMSGVLLFFFTLILGSRENSDRRQGARLLLWAPFTYCLLLLFLGNWLVLMDVFYPWRMAREAIDAADLSFTGMLNMSNLSAWLPIFAVGIIIAFLWCKAKTVKMLAGGLTLTLLAVEFGFLLFSGAGLHYTGGLLLVFIIIWILLLLPVLTEKSSRGWHGFILGVFLLESMIFSSFNPALTTAEADLFTEAPAAAEITAFIEREWPRGRVVVYGLKAPPGYPDPRMERFIHYLDFSEPMFLAQAKTEVLHLLLPPANGKFYPADSELADIHRRGRPWLLPEKTWASGWQLWRCVIMPAKDHNGMEGGTDDGGGAQSG